MKFYDLKPVYFYLWELDVIGISDPVKAKTRQELDLLATEFLRRQFAKSRYEVRFPWLEWHPELPSNYAVAKKRLSGTLSKLNAMNLFKEYKDIFLEWEKSGIIERVF